MTDAGGGCGVADLWELNVRHWRRGHTECERKAQWCKLALVMAKWFPQGGTMDHLLEVASQGKGGDAVRRVP